MKHYELEETEPIVIPDYVEDQIIRDYIERRYTWAIILATFIIGFLCGVVAS